MRPIDNRYQEIVTVNVQFNHTIVHSRDKNVAAKFLTDILGLATPTPLGPFLAVRLDNPFHRRATEINTENGIRGVYFEDPSGHNLEIITRT
jgi:hypothetical protein